MKTNRRGFWFYFFLALLGVGPVVGCAVAFPDLLDFQYGDAVTLFLPLIASVMFCSILAFFVTHVDEDTKDPLAIPLALMCAISFAGGTAALYHDFYDSELPVFTFIVSLVFSLIPNGISAIAIFVLLSRGRPRLQKWLKSGSSYSSHSFTSTAKSSGSSSGKPAARKSTGSFFDSIDPTKDYYGKHGEFDKNDDSWGTSEYIRQFRNSDPGVKLSDHFDWQELAEAESDGFLD